MVQNKQKASPQQDSGFLDFLVQENLLEKEKAAQLGGESLPQLDLEERLIRDKVFDPESLAEHKARFFALPYIDLRKVDVSKQVLQIIPQESLDYYHFAPFERQGDTLKVAIPDPTNLQALQALEFLGQKQNLQIQLFLASADSIQAALGRKQNLSLTVGEALQEFQTEQEATVKIQTSRTVEVQPSVIAGAPVIKIVDVLLSNAIEGGASDIHIEPSEKDVRVRYRIDGILHTALVLPKHIHAAVVTRIKILSNLKIDESRLPQDGRFHVETEHKKVDLRVSILPLIYGEKIVMRILDKTTSVPTLEQLGIRGKSLEWVLESMKKTHGIFLITGPTGSGKSTTLYSILSQVNSIAVNIVTLEDPVEYFIEGINQSQVNPEIGLTFQAGLRSILRQDPNIVMVGEIRDRETAELAVHTALTGHLVYSTLHTNDAIGAMPRMIDMDIEPFLLTASVNLVLAQRLVRKICPDCVHGGQSIPQDLKQEIAEIFKVVPKEYLEGLDENKLSLSQGKGCEKCDNTGYRGRMGIYEAFPVVPEIQDLVVAKAPSQKIFEIASRLGMITMRTDGILKALRGETTMQEVIRVTNV